MVMAEPKPKHSHLFHIDRNRGTCACGEIREYIEGDNPKENSFKVLQHGDTNYVDHVAKPMENITHNIPVLPHSEANKTPSLAGVPGGKPVVEKWPTKPSLRKQWLLKHRQEIISDRVKMGEVATAAKWGISKKALSLVGNHNRYGHKPAENESAKPSVPAGEPDPLPKPAPLYIPQIVVSPVGVILLNDLIDYWGERAKKTQSSAEKMVLTQTINCLEELASTERKEGIK